jgi:predicted phosphodiesterase
LTFEIDTVKDSAVRAFISDIHGNIEALCAVLKDIEQHDVEEILCLGDIVGYGPDPEACIDLVMEKAKITLMGNHDMH